MQTIFQHTPDSLKPQGRKKSLHINLSQLIQQFSFLGHRQKCSELCQTNYSAFQERKTCTKGDFSPFICRLPLQKAGFPVGWHTEQVNFSARSAQAITWPHSLLINRNICEALLKAFTHWNRVSRWTKRICQGQCIIFIKNWSCTHTRRNALQEQVSQDMF